MPTLLRYKNVHARRIPSVGHGRLQRYPEEAVAVFAAIRGESASGRRRVSRGSKQPVQRAVSRGTGSAPSAGLLSLSEVGRRTGISYPTLLRYVKLHLGELAHEGTGRNRRFHPSSVEVFARLRRESRRGRRPADGGAGPRSAAQATTSAPALKAIGRQVERLERQLSDVLRELRSLVRAQDRPIRVLVRR